MSSEITDFLSARNKSADVDEALKRKQKWLQSLHVLYSKVDGWLLEAEKSGAVHDFHRGEVQITEERLGAYMVPEISFSTGTTHIRFIPKAAYVMGADGRVDVYATSGRNVSLIAHGEKWLYVDPRTHKHPELTESSFLDLLKYLLVELEHS